MVKAAIYARVSTDEQDPQRQIDDCRTRLNQVYDNPDIELFADIISGESKTGRDQYDELWNRIDEFDAVIIHEISRLTRLGPREVEEFIANCLGNDTSLFDMEVGLEFRQDASDMQRLVNEMIAGLMAKLAQIENVQRGRRISSGMRAAQRAGKWVGQPPAGFRVKDGRLRPIFEPDDDQDSFYDIAAAIEKIDEGISPYEAAKTLTITRQGLRKIYENSRSTYLGEPDDERIVAARAEL